MREYQPINKIVSLVISLAIVSMANVSDAAVALEDRAWHEIRSKNFVVYSSVDQRKSLELLKQMEILHGLVPRMLSLEAQQPVIPTRILHVGEKSDLRKFGINGQKGGYFIEGLRENIIVVRDSKFDYLRHSNFFAYAKFLLSNISHEPLPYWVTSGFSQYISSFEITKHGSRIEMGSFPYMFNGVRFRCSWDSSVELIEDLSDWSCFDSLSAWLIVHRISQDANFTKKIDEYLGKAAKGSKGKDAFLETFELDFRKFDTELKHYFSRRSKVLHYANTDDFIFDFKTSERSISKAEATLMLGKTALGVMQLDNARHWLEISSSFPSVQSQALAQLGVVSLFEGELAKAETLFEKANSFDSNDTNVLLDAARLWLRLAFEQSDIAGRNEKLKQARELIGKAWKLNDQLPEVYAMYGRSFLLQQEYDRALDTLEAANRLLPSHKGVRFDLAQAYQWLGREHDMKDQTQPVLFWSDIGTFDHLYAYTIQYRSKDDMFAIRKTDEGIPTRKNVKVPEIEMFWY